MCEDTEYKSEWGEVITRENVIILVHSFDIQDFYPYFRYWRSMAGKKHHKTNKNDYVLWVY